MQTLFHDLGITTSSAAASTTFVDPDPQAPGEPVRYLFRGDYVATGGSVERYGFRPTPPN
jgi:hypothetical protein